MKRKFIISICTFIYASFILAGCKYPDLFYKPEVMPDIKEYLNEDGTYSKTHKDEEAKDDELSTYEGVSTDEVISNIKKCNSLFYFNKLNKTEQTIYSEILYILENVESDIAISTLDIDSIDKIFKYVMYDHPEIFYVDGYNYVRYLVDDKPKKLTFSGAYTMADEDIAKYKKYVDDYLVSFIQSLQENIRYVDDYSIIKYVYEFIIDNTDYVKNSSNNQNILSVMLNKESVCSGYTKTAQLLLNECGIECTIVVGQVKGGESHSWNLVKANGKYYYMDVTWGDSSYSLSDALDDFKYSLPPINYNYMLMPYSEIKDTHAWDELEIMPECNCIDDSYFVKEGYYFTGINEEQLNRAFDSAYDYGNDYLMIKFSDSDAYQNVRKYLLDDQKIFMYIRNHSGTVSYAENPEQLYMIFWI